MLALANKLSLNTRPIYRFVNEHSVDFDGVDDRIVTDGEVVQYEHATYSFWCKASETGQNTGVFGHGSINIGAFHFNAFGNNKPLIYLENNYYRYWVDTPAQDDGEWHHWVVYVCQSDITNSKLWVDGVLQTVDATVSSGSANAYTETLTIGSDRQVGGQSFEGRIDEFAVYDRELTQAEITRMFNTYYSPNRVANGNFSQIGNEEVTNGDFSQIGSELVTNGDFVTDTGWTKGTGWSIANGLASCNGTQSSNTELKQQNGVGGVTLDLVVGKQYKLQFDATVTSGFITSIEVGGDYNNNNITTTNSYTLYFAPSSTNDRITFAGNPDFVGSIDNVSVKEVGQDWDFGTGWSVGDSKAVGDGTSFSELIQSSTLTSGKFYKLNFEIKDYVSGTFRLLPSTRADGADIRFSGNGTQTVYYESASADLNIQQQQFLGSVTNISVKEVGQHWTFGTGWSTDGTKALFTTDGSASSAKLEQVTSFNNGATYKVLFDLIDTNNAGVFVRLAGGSFSSSISGTGSKELSLVAGSGNDIDIEIDDGTKSLSIDNIVVQELKHDATNLMLNAGAYQSANPLITSTKSMDFDGSDDYLQLGEPFSYTNHTITGWFKSDTLSSTQNIYSAADSSDDGIRVFLSSSARLKYRIGDGTSNTLTSPTDLEANRWYNFACTYDGTTQIIYIDGINVISTTPSKTISTTTNVRIGNMSWSTADLFNGKITEFGTYNRTLTSLEVASLYNQGMPTNLLVNRNNYQSGNPTVFNTKQVDFDGVDDHLDLGTQSATSSLTYSAFVKIDNNSSHTILAYGNTILRLGNASTINWWSDNSAAQLNTTISSIEDEWAHIAVTQTGQNAIIYLNGVQVNSSTSHAAVNTGSQISSIGRYAVSSLWYFKGEISQVGIWDKVLTADEVSSLYNHGLPIDLNTDQAAYESSSNLVGYWRMGSGTLDSYPLIADQTNATLGSDVIDFPNASIDLELGWSFTNGILTQDGTGSGQGSSADAVIVDTDLDTDVIYEITVSVSAYTSGDAQFLLSTGNIAVGITGIGTYIVYGKLSVDNTLHIRAGYLNFVGSIDNITIKQVQGNPAIMTNQTSSDIENGSPYANLIQNTNFTDSSEWSVAGWNITDNQAVLTGTGVGNNLFIGHILELNKTYNIVVDAEISAGSFTVMLGGGGDGYSTVGTITSTGIHTVTGKNISTTSNTLLLQSQSGSTPSSLKINSVTLAEVNTGLQGYWKMGDGTNDEFPVIYDQVDPTLGSEIVVNGDFATETDWTFTNVGFSAGAITFDDSLDNLFQAFADTLGKTYKLVVTKTGSGTPRYRTGHSGSDGILRNLPNSNVVYFTATSDTNRIQIYGDANSNDYVLNSVSVKEVQGNPATMTNMVEGNITNIHPLTKIRNYYRMGDGILDGYPIIQDQTSPNLAHIPTTNLVTYSEDFSGYTIGGITLTSQTETSPINTNNATLVTFTSGGHYLRKDVTVTGNTVYTLSFYVKRGTATELKYRMRDITNGVDILVPTSYYSQTSNDWKRIQVTVTTPATCTTLGAYMFSDALVTGTAFLWGTQVEAQSQATAYIKSDGIAAVRKSSTTNLISYSEDFSQSYWQKNSITLESGHLAPNGTNTAYKVTGIIDTSWIGVLIADTNQRSIYAKTVSGTGTVNLLGDNSGFTVTNEWQRFQYKPTSNTYNFAVDFRNGTNITEVLIWGYQSEDQTQAETYAKTTGLPVTIDLFTENNYGTMTNMSASDIVEDTP